MKFQKSGNLARLVAFFVIAVILVCTVTLGASGWQFLDNNDNNSGKVEDNNNISIDNTDNNTVGDNGQSNTPDTNPDEGSSNTQDPDNIPVVKPIPEYLHYLTGLEISEDEAYKKPLCFVFDPTSPLYGISSSYLTIEIPTEDGKTRLLGFSDQYASLGKVGTLAATRKYISDVVGMFGGALISAGNDDAFDYTTGNTVKTEAIDLTKTTGYSYSEYTDFIYTNGDLIKALKANGLISSSIKNTPILPYIFGDYYSDRISFSNIAGKASIKFADGNITELIYKDDIGQYILSKNSSLVNDILTDKQCTYDNVFVLFADSNTIETSAATQTIINTSDSGVGYYFTEGTYTQITWSVDFLGNMTFKDSNGEKLTVNRGSSYIAYAKSSSMSNLIIK